MDHAWISLFVDPTDPKYGTSEDYKEHSLLVQVSNAVYKKDENAFRQSSQALLSHPGVSLISQSIINIIRGDAQKAVDDLTSIKNVGHVWSQWWNVQAALCFLTAVAQVD